MFVPPKAKFTKQKIIDAAMQIVRREGFSALTARALGTELGSSARPIFTIFQNMEEVQQSVVVAAKELYAEYVERGLSEELPFKGVGTQYILFSIEEPKLFQLLFMEEQEQVPDLSGVLPLIDENYDKILRSIEKGYGLRGASAEKLYQHLWIYTHGIATLCATRMCCFTENEISEMMTEVFTGIMAKMKGDGR